MMLREPVGILMPRRLASGKMGGALAEVEPHKLLGRLFRVVAGEAAGVSPDDVIAGSVRNSLGNIARVAALDAGLPVELPAVTVDRQCASGLEALTLAAAKINAGLADTILVGGVESATRCPWFMEKTSRPYAWSEPRPYPIRLSTPEVGDPPMGETAEILADDCGIAREEMDAFAAESHCRAAEAGAAGAFAGEIVPFELPRRKGPPAIHEVDETVRADTSIEALAKLPPVFRRDGRVTAGNSSPLTDGAAACIAASRTLLEQSGLAPDAWLKAVSVVGVDPTRMGIGPVPAIRRLLKESQLELDQIDLFEINEAFAAQILAVNRDLQIPSDRLNVNGGAIALGHPLGASGLRLVVTLTHALRSRGLRRGIASLCVGGGQGVAALVEVDS